MNFKLEQIYLTLILSCVKSAIKLAIVMTFMNGPLITHIKCKS